MFAFLFTLTSSYYEYPEIKIFPTQVVEQPVVTKVFASADAADAIQFFNQMLGNEKGISMLKKLKFAKTISTDIISMNGAMTSDFIRQFSNKHTILNAKRDDKGQIVVKISNVDIKCNVESQIIDVQKHKHKIFGVIKYKTSKHRVAMYRALSASEVTRIYQKMRADGQSKINSAISSVKNI